MGSSLISEYRPRSFDEIVGQEHVTTTLRNALALDRVSHTYLFTGPTGTGKTAVARILAASLVCADRSSPEACGLCPECEAVFSGRSRDLRETDLVLGHHYDAVSALAENARYHPFSARATVLVLDSAEWLWGKGARPLLRLLDDPPAARAGSGSHRR